MIRIALLSFGILLSALCMGQTVDELISEGIELHDAGQYEEAMAKYEEALKLDPKSIDVWYEMSYTYMMLQDYKNAYKYSHKVIKADDKHLVEAYMVAGSSLDNLGKVDQSIELFKEAIELHGDHYLYHYNLGLTYYKDGQLANAHDALVNAIKANSQHSSSHMLLGYLMDDMGKQSQSMFSLYHYLLLEPNTARNQMAYNLLMKHWGANVSQGEDENGKNVININMPKMDDSDPFSSVDLYVAMKGALNLSEEEKELTPFAKFIDNTTSFFQIAGELYETKDDKKKKKDKMEFTGIYWEYYIPMFYRLAQSEHMPAFCAYICRKFDREAAQWYNNHPQEINELAMFLRSEP